MKIIQDYEIDKLRSAFVKVIIGSNNPTKIKAVQDIFKGDEIISLDVPSNVSPQPFTDEETRKGAVNRAKQCAKTASDAIGIGLEGGVMYIDHELYLCNWGALVTASNEKFTASGARILLPSEIAIQLEKGSELGDLMDAYAAKKEVSKKEGAIGIFTNDLITRKEMFAHVVTLLKGQWEYSRQRRINETER